MLSPAWGQRGLTVAPSSRLGYLPQHCSAMLPDLPANWQRVEGSLAIFSALEPIAANCVHCSNFLPYVLSLLLMPLCPSFVLSTNTETYFC